VLVAIRVGFGRRIRLCHALADLRAGLAFRVVGAQQLAVCVTLLADRLAAPDVVRLGRARAIHFRDHRPAAQAVVAEARFLARLRLVADADQPVLGVPVVLARFVLQQVAGCVVLRRLTVHRLHLVQRVRHDRLLGRAARGAGAVVRCVVAVAPVVPAAAVVGQQPVRRVVARCDNAHREGERRWLCLSIALISGHPNHPQHWQGTGANLCRLCLNVRSF